jgi:hypothetical protein
MGDPSSAPCGAADVDERGPGCEAKAALINRADTLDDNFDASSIGSLKQERHYFSFSIIRGFTRQSILKGVALLAQASIAVLQHWCL